MAEKNYDSLILELTRIIQDLRFAVEIKEDGDYDLRYRLTELFKNVKESDAEKFAAIAGMQSVLQTEKTNFTNSPVQEVIDEDQLEVDLLELKKSNQKKWVKDLYRNAVRRCHPDVLGNVERQYRNELVSIYKNVTENYESDKVDLLMVECYKLLVKPKIISNEQFIIIEKSIKDNLSLLNELRVSSGYVWANFDENLKENFLINMMKQKGVRFIDKTKVKEVLRRNISKRKIGEKPKNKLRKRVKNKK